MGAKLFRPAEILIPKEGADLARWAVVACDQFTSQPEYWDDVQKCAGDAPSTLNIILPEVFLEQGGTEKRIADIHSSMEQYLGDTLLRKINGFVYVERHTSSGVRQGLVGCVDLEAYSYNKGDKPMIRPSENTVLERIPPRLAVRRGAKLESPHILMLIDDPEETVIEPLAKIKNKLTQIYDFDLMLGGGNISGWEINAEDTVDSITRAIAALEDAGRFRKMYGTAEDEKPFALAVGDGNHSLATAKAAWEEIKPGLAPQQRETHPARYCLVELNNVQSGAIEIEPIYRVVFDADCGRLLEAAEKFAASKGAALAKNGGGEQEFTLLDRNMGEMKMSVQNPWRPLAVGTVDDLLEEYLKTEPKAKIDYIHGEDAVRQMVEQGAVGVILPALQKSDLFRGVALGGVLPKKTFSMGHATDKRYYLECREIL